MVEALLDCASNPCVARHVAAGLVDLGAAPYTIQTWLALDERNV